MQITLEKACELLRQGQVVAIPTETVYGLAASLSNTKAIEHIYKLKRRPTDNPLIIHMSDSSQIKLYAKHIVPGFDLLASTFWPGPMTLVLPAQKKWVPSIVRSGLDTIAFRIPAHPLTLQVLKKVGPLVMPSANLSGKPSATCSKHVENDFGKNFPVLNGEKCRRGVESTILIYHNKCWEIVRLGALSPEVFEPLLGYEPPVVEQSKQKPICPGQLFRHYAPKATLILDPKVSPESIGVVVGFSGQTYPKNCRVFTLGNKEKPQEIAKNLYDTLRNLDIKQINMAWVDMDFPSNGLWKTIRERLKKASAK